MVELVHVPIEMRRAQPILIVGEISEILPILPILPTLPNTTTSTRPVSAIRVVAAIALAEAKSSEAIAATTGQVRHSPPPPLAVFAVIWMWLQPTALLLSWPWWTAHSDCFLNHFTYKDS